MTFCNNKQAKYSLILASWHSSEFLALLLSDLLAGAYGASGTGCQRRALTASVARSADDYLAALARPSS